MHTSLSSGTVHTLGRLALAATVAVTSFWSVPGAAAADGATLVLRPHCVQNEGEVDWMLGPIPDVDTLVTLGPGRCFDYEVEDPQTLRTEVLEPGDEVDMDLVLKNPSKSKVKNVRAWLSYDPEVLEGEEIVVNPAFSLVTPGEKDFDATQGYVMIDASTAAGAERSEEEVVVARVRMKVKDTPEAGTYISFYDVQRTGHTHATGVGEAGDESIVNTDPGILHVRLKGNGAAPAGSSSSASTANSPGASSASSTTLKLPNGAACTQNSECLSNNCTNNMCVTLPVSSAASVGSAQRTAFGLLQVRNLRATTEDTSVFLAWDPIQSSQLQGYNVYYGTTSGRYIQRKSVGPNVTTLTLRDLPKGTTYYFAVRAVNTLNEESAFSQEVSITIGDPSSSTSPLSVGGNGAPQNPLTGNVTNDLPGETGLSTTLAVVLLISVGFGLLIASRRQVRVLPSA